jgi:hypothetical protein
MKFEKQINKATVFLKQTPKNKKINAFSTCVVHLWFANIDIQFILTHMQLQDIAHHI